MREALRRVHSALRLTQFSVSDGRVVFGKFKLSVIYLVTLCDEYGMWFCPALMKRDRLSKHTSCRVDGPITQSSLL